MQTKHSSGESYFANIFDLGNLKKLKPLNRGEDSPIKKPQKSNMSIPKIAMFKGSYLFQTIILGPSMLVFWDFLGDIT